jgi:hypothetical protein
VQRRPKVHAQQLAHAARHDLLVGRAEAREAHGERVWAVRALLPRRLNFQQLLQRRAYAHEAAPVCVCVGGGGGGGHAWQHEAPFRKLARHSHTRDTHCAHGTL